MTNVAASMRMHVRGVTTALFLLTLGWAAGCNKAPAQGPVPADNAEARTLDDFQKRIDGYVAVHRQVEASVPPKPKDATPTQIDTQQRDFGRKLTAARAGAKQGDLLTPEMQALLRRHLGVIFSGPDGVDMKGSIMDENPVGIQIHVNDRYPDEVPLSTMPPEVLKLLPKMPEELEYRFVGRSLVIMDEHAHLIADIAPDVIPQ